MHQALNLGGGRPLRVVVALVVTMAVACAGGASEPNISGFSFTMPATIPVGQNFILHTGVNGYGSEGAWPETSDLMLVRAWFDHYGFTGLPCLVDGEIVEYPDVDCGNWYCLSCRWSGNHEYAAAWFGPPTFEFWPTSCGDGRIRFHYWGAQHEGPYVTDWQYFTVTGCALASWDDTTPSNTVCVGEEVEFTATGYGDEATWDFGDGTSASGLSVTHSWRNTGSYTVTMTATTGDRSDVGSMVYQVVECGTVVGMVKASDIDSPLPGATVLANAGSSNWTALSEPPAGMYVLHLPAPGSYDLTASYPGYQDAGGSATLAAGQSEPTVVHFTLDPDTTADDPGHRLGDQPDNEDDPVNAATGNLTLSTPVCSFPATPVLGFRFDLAYNSLAADTAGPVGHGWTHSWAMSADISSSSTTVSFPDGHTQRFIRQAPGDPWSPAGGATDATLEDDGAGGVVATLPGGLWMAFDASGALTGIGDPSGDVMEVTHAAGHVDHVTDPTGRRFDFAYDANGLLSAVSCSALSASNLVELAYDPNGNLTAVTDPLGHSWSFTYDGAHRLLTETDRRGNQVLTVTYDASGRVASEADALGAVTTFSRRQLAGGGQEVTITPPSGRAVRRIYNAAGRLVRAVDGLGHTAAYGWQDGRLAVLADKAGGVLSLEYDADGKLLGATGPGDESAAITYDAQGRPAVITHPSGAIDSIGYDGSGRLARLTAAGGADLAMGYDTDGHLNALRRGTDSAPWTLGWNASRQVETVTDPLGNTTTYGYGSDGRVSSVQRPGLTGSLRTSRDLAGNLLWMETPEGRRTSFTYDAGGNVTSRTFEPTGATTTWVYDAANQIVTVRDPYGGETHMTYDADGNVVSVTDPDGVTTTFVYDDRGQRSETVLPWGGHRRTEHDPDGRITAVVEPDGARTSYSWTEDGHLASITDALGNTTSFRYDRHGQRIVRTDPLGRETVSVLDTAGRLRTRIRPDGGQTVYVRDAQGRVAAITDGEGSTWRFARDGAGRLAAVTDPAGRTSRSTYDAAGRKISTTLRDGREIQYAYDEDDELVSTTLPGGDVVTTDRSFSSTGETVTTSSGGQTVTDVFDLMGRRVAHTGIFGATVGVTWTPGSRLDAVEYPGGVSADYQYDSAGRLQRIVDWDGNTTVFHYDGAGRLESLDLPGGVRTAYERDGRGLITRIHHTAPGGTTILDITLTRDALGRITGVERSGGPPETVTERDMELSRGAADRLVAVTQGQAAMPVTHDALGNLLTAPSLQLTWDPLSRPLTAVRDGVAASYTWDPGGTLAEVTAGGVTRRYLWFESRLVATMDGAGTVLLRHVGVGGRLLYSVEAGGGVRVYLADERGNVAAVTDGSGTVVATRSYDAFGNLSGSSGGLADDELGFGGAFGVLTDAAGLVHMGPRVYDPRLGQFLSEDPLGPEMVGNLYAYALGDPIDNADPSGLAAGPADQQLFQNFLVKWLFEGVELGWRDPGGLWGEVPMNVVEEYGIESYLELTELGSGLAFEDGPLLGFPIRDAYLLDWRDALAKLHEYGVSMVEQIHEDYNVVYGPVARQVESAEATVLTEVEAAASAVTEAAGSAGETVVENAPALPSAWVIYKALAKAKLMDLQYTTCVLSVGELSLSTVAIGVTGAAAYGWFVGRTLGGSTVWWDGTRWLSLDDVLVRAMTPQREPNPATDEPAMIRKILEDNGISWSTYAKWQRKTRDGRW